METKDNAETLMPAWFSYREASRYCGGLGRTTLTMLVTTGAVPAVKIGKRVLISRSGLDEYLARHSYVPNADNEA
jgi:excisionase family DNA binding protein